VASVIVLRDRGVLTVDGSSSPGLIFSCLFNFFFFFFFFGGKVQDLAKGLSRQGRRGDLADVHFRASAVDQNGQLWPLL